jgi:hypothetical protein
MVKVVRNRRSGKYFIFLRNTGLKQGLCITNDVKPRSLPLSMDLFDHSMEEEEQILLSKEIITDRQLEIYREYETKEETAEETVERLIYLYEEEMTPYEQASYVSLLKTLLHDAKQKDRPAHQGRVT